MKLSQNKPKIKHLPADEGESLFVVSSIPWKQVEDELTSKLGDFRELLRVEAPELCHDDKTYECWDCGGGLIVSGWVTDASQNKIVTSFACKGECAEEGKGDKRIWDFWAFKRNEKYNSHAKYWLAAKYLGCVVAPYKASPKQKATQLRNVNAALIYASLGLRVVPCYIPKGKGQCSCGDKDCGSPGKHPR